MSWIQPYNPGICSAIWRENDQLYAGFIPGQYTPTTITWWVATRVSTQYLLADHKIFLAGDIIAEGVEDFLDTAAREHAWNQILRAPSAFLMEKML